MSRNNFTPTISYADFFALDFRKLPTEVLKTIKMRISGELHKRNSENASEKRILDAAFAGIPSSIVKIDKNASPYLELLVNQDWSHLFPGGDPDPKYYVYAHVKPSQSKIQISCQNLSLKFQGFPFYIGKGCDGRAFDLKRNQGHGATLRELLNDGKTPEQIVYFIKRAMPEAKALELESKLIYFFGTKYEQQRQGLLVNLDLPPRPDFVPWKQWVSMNASQTKSN